MNKTTTDWSKYALTAEQIAAVNARTARDAAEEKAHQTRYPKVRTYWKDGMLNAR